MINLDDLYDSMAETRALTLESEELLNKLLSLSSPMKFDAAFATDEQLDRLEQELENTAHLQPRVQEMIYTVLGLRAIASSKAVFI
jgi:hypothetical protein